jgi:hypothetical protein
MEIKLEMWQVWTHEAELQACGFTQKHAPIRGPKSVK